MSHSRRMRSLASVASLMNRPPVWWAAEVVLDSARSGWRSSSDTGAEYSRARSMSRSSSALDVAVEPRLDLGPPGALGVVGEELPGAVDQVAEVGVGERPRSGSGRRRSGAPAAVRFGVGLGLEAGEQGQRLVAVRRCRGTP